jgi:hypothetical protein
MPSIPTHQVSPDDLDALVAAPQYHSLLFENEAVRVLNAAIPPGQTVPLHTHCWPAVQYILGWSDFIRRDAAGTILLDSRTIESPAPGAALWSAPMPPHTLQNVGQSELRVISVELKHTT